MAVIAAREPGITFETRTPSVTSPLPRMDIAGFVGFAPSGPVDLPVAVEDVARFHDVFGKDLPLARDRETDAIAYASLPPAVRAFFRNGGARCWIVRVADNAATNRFPIPGLLTAPVGAADLRAAIAFARSPGSWSDAFAVNATLARRPLVSRSVSPPSDGPFRVNGLAPGDTIQIDFPQRPDMVAFHPVPASGVRGPLEIDIPTADAFWFRRATSSDLGVASPPAGITWLPAPVSARWMSTVHPESDPVLPILGWGVTEEDAFVIDAGRDDVRGLQAGSWIAVDLATAPPAARPLLLLLVDRIDTTSGVASPPSGEAVRVTASRAWWPLDANAAVLMVAGLDVRAAVVDFELWVRDPERPVRRLADLGFASPHPLYWGDVPDDVIAFEEPDQHPSRRESIAASLLERVMDPRFPLSAPSRTRGGLASLSSSLFIDPALRDVNAASLTATAFHVQYVQPSPASDRIVGRRLTGMHALFPIDEVSAIAVPDAVQRPWVFEPSAMTPLGAPTLTEVSPEPCRVRVSWTPPTGSPNVTYTLQASLDPHFDVVARSWDVAATELAHPDDVFPPCPGHVFYRVRAVSTIQGTGPWSNTLWAIVPAAPFAPCPDEQPASPAPLSISEERGRFVVEWSFPTTFEVIFTLERAADPEFASAAVVYVGTGHLYEVLRGSEPVVYFRVSAEVAGRRSPWSVTAQAGVIAHETYALTSPAAYDDQLLLRIHAALIRMCAARGDAHAVLGLPEHFREEAAAEYVETLSSTLEISDAERVLSYAALFHPWIVVRETTGRPDLATAGQPPDGAVCGVIAARTLRNGAWYSAANQVLIGALAVSPPLADVRLRLLDARVNPVVQQPRGFVAMDALTLHPGDEFGELHVRRLLILLRRLALREGTAFVFRSNDNALRRFAERQFEQVLGDLFVRGAFAGARHEEGYVVVADDTVNTRQSRDAGRFIVELRVAPSHPLMFLTVRLVQEGGAWQATEEP